MKDVLLKDGCQLHKIRKLNSFQRATWAALLVKLSALSVHRFLCAVVCLFIVTGFQVCLRVHPEAVVTQKKRLDLGQRVEKMCPAKQVTQKSL